jgi:3-oxoacyl-[acyl-carrier protein] reductase
MVVMDLGLDGRAYVLTGASRGLGFATAACLVADGARVVVSSRHAANVETAVEKLNSQAGEARAVGAVADLADPEAPTRLVEAARSAFGRLDGALLSVGGPAPGTAAKVSDEQWRDAFETVFLGAVRATRVVLNSLDQSGAIGLVLSTSTRTPIVGLGISNGLRPGLAGVIKDMAEEYGPTGARLFGLMPGRILTDRARELFEATGDADAAQASLEATIPLRRIGGPDEFGRVAAFLLSPAASYVTGVCVPVDGGALRAL